MLQFSPRQMAGFADRQRAVFAERAQAHLCMFDPDRFARLGRSEQRKEVTSGIETARHSGLLLETEIVVCLEARCLVLSLRDVHQQNIDWVANLFESDSVDLARTFAYVRDVARNKLNMLVDLSAGGLNA